LIVGLAGTLKVNDTEVKTFKFTEEKGSYTSTYPRRRGR